MEDLEVVVRGERFVIHERQSHDGTYCYDWSWENGPLAGTYGFTVGRKLAGAHLPDRIIASRMKPDELREMTAEYVEAFYNPGGQRDTDFPDHVAAEDQR